MAGGLSAQVGGKKKAMPVKMARPPLKDVKSKEIVTEFSCNDNATVFLENILRRVNIRTTHENKVRLVTTVYYQGDPHFTDADWLQKLELGISGTPENVVVKSGNLKRPGAKVATPSMPLKRVPDTLIANGIAVFDSSGNWVNRKSDIRRNITLYVPAGVKLDIENKYADINLENNVNELKLRLANGGVTMMDVQKLTVISVYGNVYARNVVNADIEITNGRYKAKNSDALIINSKNSAIELDMVNQLKMVSQADQYEIEEANEIVATKNYGDLRVTGLKSLLDLTGINANIKIRSISPGTHLIKIDDQYADLRLPVDNLKDYTVSFEGKGCNIYAPFEKPTTPDTPFDVTVGTGRTTSFHVKCNNCTVDFK